MCGRFVDPNMRADGLDTSWLKINPFPRRWNVKPTQEILIAAKNPLEAMMARWGLIPSWFDGVEAKDWKAATINARIEEAQDKPTYRSVWRHGRCLIPVGGYYEWRGEKGAKQPYYFQPAGNEAILWIAGLASRWQDLLTCTMMTRAANASVQPIHDRMPVVLDTEEQAAWLAGSDDPEIGAGARLRHHAVRPFGTSDEGPGLIESPTFFPPIAGDRES